MDLVTGEFIWVDLSTFDPPKAKRFYGKVLGWEFSEEPAGYWNASIGDTACAALYEMPEFFQKIRMPSFWMTYIAVDDIEATVVTARELGAKVELEEVNAMGKVALIRDPAGAGFTCYQGNHPSARVSNPRSGQWMWSELFVSDFSKVRAFYEGMFGWEFESEGPGSDRHTILHRGQKIGAVQIASNDIKGDKEFWGVFFTVDSAAKAKAQINAAGGKVIYEHTTTEGSHHLAYDSQGAAFFVTERDSKARDATGGNPVAKNAGAPKWRTMIGIVVVALAVLFEMDWIWGVLFLYWIIPDLFSGTTYFIEPLQRSRNPWLYWTVVVTWLVLSAYLLLPAG
ncbi:MAG: VOC family protein [Verrucomicrobiota bacterium]